MSCRNWGLRSGIVVPQYCNTAAFPSIVPYDQEAYLTNSNTLVCLPPNYSFMTSVNIPTTGNSRGTSHEWLLRQQHSNEHFHRSLALNLSTTIFATSNTTHIPNPNQGDINVPPITFESQIPASLQVHFVNSPHVQEMTTVNAARLRQCLPMNQSRVYNHATTRSSKVKLIKSQLLNWTSNENLQNY